MTDYMDNFTWDMVHESAMIDGASVFNPTIEAYRHIVKEGLPSSSHLEKPKKIGVIGAGMSGMVAAELLSDAGYEVTILEAANRVGGRIHTVDFPDGDSSEAGAMRLLEDYQLVFDYLDKLNLEKHLFINHDPGQQDWILVNGMKLRRSEYLQNPDIVGFDTVGDERGKIAYDLWLDALKPITDMVDPKKGLDTPENWRKVAKRYGQYSVYTYLINETNLSPGAIDMILVMLFLEARMHLSVLQQVVEAVDHRPDAKYYGINKGSRELPRALAASITAPNNATNTQGKPNRVPVTINLNAFVEKLVQNEDSNTVTVRWADGLIDHKAPRLNYGNDQIYHPQPKNEQSQTFDAVIVTCTPPAMRRLQFTPSLPADKRRALREINFSASTKIFLQFKEKFWEQDGFKHGSSLTDLPSRGIYYPSTDDSKIVIASYTWAGAARGWDSLSPQQRVDQALDDLAQLHGEHIRDLYVCGQSYSWLLDNYSMGEAAMIFPEQLNLQVSLARPVGNIYFAGDTLSFKVAWIEGAIESGMRAVLELVGLPPVAPTASSTN